MLSTHLLRMWLLSDKAVQAMRTYMWDEKAGTFLSEKKEIIFFLKQKNFRQPLTSHPLSSPSSPQTFSSHYQSPGTTLSFPVYLQTN